MRKIYSFILAMLLLPALAFADNMAISKALRTSYSTKTDSRAYVTPAILAPVPAVKGEAESFTLGAWVNVSGYLSQPGGANNSVVFGYGARDHCNDNGCWNLCINSAGKFNITGWGAKGAGGVIEDSSVSTGEWHYVVVAYDSEAPSLSVYMDGELVVSREMEGKHEWMSNEHPALYFASYGFGGLLDEAQIWNRPLSADDVKAAMKDANKVDGLVGLYTFDENNGTAGNFANQSTQEVAADEVMYYEECTTYTSAWENGLAYVSNSTKEPTLAEGREISAEVPATFALSVVNEAEIPYTLTTADGAEVDAAAVESGTELKLTLTVPETHVLTSVLLGEEELTANEGVYEFTMPEEAATLTINARTKALYTVTIAQVEGGTITVTAGDAEVASGDTVAEGTEITVTATADNGYQLVSVLVDGVATEETTFVPTADVTISAEYREFDMYLDDYAHVEGVSTHSGDRGINSLTITPDTGDALTIQGPGLSGHNLYTDATDQKLVVTPGTVLTFSGNCANTQWMHNYVYIDFDNDGRFDFDPSKTELNNDLVAFTGYSLASNNKWGSEKDTADPTKQSDGKTTNNGNYFDMPTVTIPEDMAPGTYRIRLKNDWNNTHPYGRTANTIYGLQKNGNFIGANGGYIIDFVLEVAMPTVALNVVNEAEIPYTLTTAEGAEVDAAAVEPGTELKLTLTVPETHILTSVLLGEEELTATEGVYEFTMPEEDATLTINARTKALYTVTIAEVEGGTITVTAGDAEVASGDTVAEGTEITVTATADKGYELVSVLVDGVATEETTFVPTADVTISAEFAEFVVEYCEPLPHSGHTYAGSKTTYRKDRGVSSLEVSDGTNSISFNGGGTTAGRPVYLDATTNKLTTYAGKTVTIKTNGSGEWMNTFIFVDFDLNGFTSDDKVYDNATGNSNPYAGTRTFNVPDDQPVGEYRVRYMVDWDGVSPCQFGQAKTYASNNDNGEAVIDFVIEVVEPIFSLTVENPAEVDYTLTTAEGDELDLEAVDGGTALKLTLDVPENVELKGVKLNGSDLTATEGEYLFNMPMSNSTLTIDAEVKAEYTVTIEQVEGGTITVTAGDTEIASGDVIYAGTEITVTATADDSHMLVSVLVDGVATEETTFVPTADVTISAEYRERDIYLDDYAHVEGVSTHDSKRGIKSLTITPDKGKALTVQGPGITGHNLYTDATDQSIKVTPGTVLTFTGDCENTEWMHNYVYIDFGNDGRFDVDPASTELNNDLVAFTGYSLASNNKWGSDKDTADPTKQSDGKATDNTNYFNMPTVTIPEDMAPGTYRLRLKNDWNSTHPYGRTDNTIYGLQKKGNNIDSNGGYIIDVTLVVEEAKDPEKEYEYFVNLSATNCDVWIYTDEDKTNDLMFFEAEWDDPDEGVNYMVYSTDVPDGMYFEIIPQEGYIFSQLVICDEDFSDYVTDNSAHIDLYELPLKENVTNYMLIACVEDPNYSALDAIGADNDGKVEYYNLQGIKVAAENMNSGIYIARKNGKAVKVLIKK